jgi:hypothetical protein
MLSEFCLINFRNVEKNGFYQKKQFLQKLVEKPFRA